MTIDIITLFPESLAHVLGESILGRAAKKGLIEINCRQIRDFTENKQKQVDDYPYGGGWGCVMMAQPLASCLEDIVRRAPPEERRRVIYLSPQGRTFDQACARRLAREYDRLVLVCGHYEGVDERFIEECVDEELSLGDFVLTGGEIAALAVADAVCRLVPGVLADEECYTGESHWAGLLEYPQYTRPEEWRGRRVPEVLQSGDHAAVARWRRKESLRRTRARRPDLFRALEVTDREGRKILAELELEENPPENRLSFESRRMETGDIDGVLALCASGEALLLSPGETPDADALGRDAARGEGWVFLVGGVLAGAMSLSGPEASGSEPRAELRWAALRRDLLEPGLFGEMADFAEALALGLGAAVLGAAAGEDSPVLALLGRLGFAEADAPDGGDAAGAVFLEKRLV